MESLCRVASGMDAAKAVKGHGWPLRGDPRNSDGMREVERSETRMEGQAFLLTFFATKKGESPSRAKPMLPPTTINGSARQSRMRGWPSFWLLFLGQTRKSDAPCKAKPVARAEESAAYLHLTLRQLCQKAPTAKVPQC